MRTALILAGALALGALTSGGTAHATSTTRAANPCAAGKHAGPPPRPPVGVCYGTIWVHGDFTPPWSPW